MENLKYFTNKKIELLQHITKTINIAQQLKSTTVIEKEQENHKQLSEEQFLLTVVGEFSRGKSMFINSLLGEQILPSKIKPTTAMITSVSYAENQTYELHFRNHDETRVLLHDEFMELSAPREPDLDEQEDIERYNKEMDYFKDIKLAEIQYPSDFCKLGVKIIDTPGTNDIDVAREEITLSFVPKSDAVIVVLSATQPVTSDEVTFIKERILSEHISKVFVILNRIDLLQPEDQMKTIQYTKDKLAEFIPNARVYPMASKDALTIKMSEKGQVLKNKKQKYFRLEETGLAQFEKELSYFLEYEKGQVKLQKHSNKLIQSIDELINNTIAIRLAALNMEIGEIDDKIAKINPQIEKYRLRTKEIVGDLTVGLRNSEKSLFDQIKNELRDFFNQTIDVIDNYRGDLDDPSEIRRFMSGQLEKKEKPFKDKLIKLKKEAIDLHLSTAYKQLNNEQSELNKSIYATFNIEIKMSEGLSISNDDFTTDEIFGMLAIGASAGVIGIMLAPALVVLGAIGAVVGGFAFFDDIVGFFKSKSRERKINKIKASLKDNVTNEVNNTIDKFKHEWKVTITEIEHKFLVDVDKKIEAIQDNFYQIRLENEKNKLEREHIKEEIQQQKVQLQQIKEKTIGNLSEGLVHGVK